MCLRTPGSKKPITYMAENGYMSGTSGSKFSPHQTTTRAMFVTVLGPRGYEVGHRRGPDVR